MSHKDLVVLACLAGKHSMEACKAMYEAIKPSWDATWLGTRSLRWYRQRTLASGWLAVNCPRSWILLNLSDLRIWIAFNKEHKRFNKSMQCCYLFLDFFAIFQFFLEPSWNSWFFFSVWSHRHRHQTLPDVVTKVVDWRQHQCSPTNLISRT